MEDSPEIFPGSAACRECRLGWWCTSDWEEGRASGAVGAMTLRLTSLVSAPTVWATEEVLRWAGAYRYASADAFMNRNIIRSVATSFPPASVAVVSNQRYSVFGLWPTHTTSLSIR